MRKQLFFVLVCLVSYGYSQEVPDLAPPTPEVAAMGKYLDVPMSLNTGTPNISVPLTSISEGGLNASVSLSYHASGIRVSEMASRVGLGWALNAGGMISRQVRGIADDHQEGFINTSNTIDHYFAQNANNRSTLFDLAMQRQQDYESDMYHINVAGLAGKFFFNQDGTIVVHQKSDLKIVALRDGITISGWQVTTPMGIQYIFGVVPGTNQKVHEIKETRFHTSTTNLPDGYINTTGWYLTQISDYNGNHINFNYSQGATAVNYWNITGQSKNLLGNGSGCSLNNVEPISMSEDIYKPIYLNSITTTGGSIVLEYNHNRTDLQHDKALTAVKLLDYNNALIDRYELDHGYFVAPNGLERLLEDGTANQRTHRLYLKSVTQQKGSKSNKVHRFTYNQTHQLPERFSFSQDFWGYYNGANNSKLYPKIVYVPYTTPIQVNGANRTVSEAHTKALLLEEITYPTGGKTKFIFESNTLSGNQDFFVGTKMKDELIPGGQLQNEPEAPGTTFETTFTLNELTDVYYKVDVEVSCTGTDLDCPKIELYKGSTLVTPWETKDYSDIQRLSAGTYTIKIENGPFQGRNYVDIMTTRKVAFNANTANEAIVGGLRVKEIQYLDQDNSMINSKKYDYQQFDNALVSSGRALNPPIFISKKIPFTNCSQDVLRSNAIFPLNGQGGSHVNYLNVTEYNIGEENGKTEYTYSYASDGAISASNEFDGIGQLMIPATDYSHRRGQLVEQKHYAYETSSGSFTLIEKTKNNFIPANDLRTESLMMGKVGDLNEAQRYDNISERYLPSSTEKTTYYPSGNVKTTSQYTYDTGYNGRTMPTQTTTTNSLGETVITKTFYPGDITSTTSLGKALSTEAYTAIGNLKTAHRIGEVIEQESWVDGQQMNTQRTNYKVWNGVALPRDIQTAKAGANLDNRVEYLAYDSKGNPLEVKQAKGTSIIYIWGYNNNYPIAKISNASYTGMPTAVTNIINSLKAASNNENTAAEEQTMRDLADDLRAQSYFENAQITSYTFDPLVGVTSMTDPRGYTTFYTYDEFNRLAYTLDDDAHVVQQNRYNYEGQQAGSGGITDVTITNPGDTAVVPGQAVTFTANATGGNAGQILYSWKVNGATEQCATSTTFTKTFNSEDSYTISLLAHDTQAKLSASSSKTITATYPALQTPSISGAANTYIVKGASVSYTASGIGGGSGNLSYEWYVNNVKQSTTSSTFSANTSATGTYTIYFKIVDTTTGATRSTANRVLRIYNPLSTPAISASKSHIVKGTSVSFSASGIGGGSGNRRYEWYVNNVKQSATGTTFSYNFPSATTYSVRFKVVDTTIPSHAVWSNTRTVRSYNTLNTPNVSPSLGSDFLKGSQITFNTSGISGGSGSRRYEWYINNAKQSYTGTKFVRTFSSAGTYTIKFRVIDNNISGLVRERSVTVYSRNPLSTPSISASKSYIVKGTSVSFSASGIGGGSGSRRYEWYINNVKQSGTGTSFSYNFPSAGTYTVKFRVIDNNIQPTHTKWSSNTRTVYSYNPLSISTTPANAVITDTEPSVTFSLNRSGGSGSFTQRWTIRRISSPATQYSGGSGTSLTFAENVSGEYEIDVEVTDTKTGQKKTKTSAVLVIKGFGGGF